jgi:glycosyltransferase involved in cell wall biosynthesis
MRIMFSCGSPRWGGLERMAVVLSRGLAGRGHDVRVLCRQDSPVHRRLQRDLICEPVLGGSDVNPLVVARAAAALRRHRSDIAIGNMYKDPRWTGIAARLLGIPFVYRQEIDEPYRPGLYYRAVYGLADAHVVNSRATARTILDSAPWLPPRRVFTIPNGIDTEAFAAASPAPLGLPDDAVIFGCIGRWDRAKGIFDLAAAWPHVTAAMPRAHLVIAGWGAEQNAFRDAMQRAINVHWLGMHDDMPALLRALHVLVAPTHREGFGLAILEAMAAGTAVVTTDASSIPDLVRDGTHGRIVAVGSAEQLAAAMVELGSDPAMRRRMGAAAMERARRFSMDVMLDRHEELLEAVLARRRPALPTPGWGDGRGGLDGQRRMRLSGPETEGRRAGAGRGAPRSG